MRDINSSSLIQGTVVDNVNIEMKLRGKHI